MTPSREDDMAGNKENYEKIKGILAATQLLDAAESKSGQFRFPIYMTESMAKTDVLDLDLSVRSSNCLKRANIMTIGDLCNNIQSSADLKKIRNCGATSVAEIMDHLFAYQFFALKPERRGSYLAKVLEMNAGIME